jgi:kynurenine formamidase
MTAGFREWTGRMSNWGRWGDDDQLGTINLIDERTRASAFALVTVGRVFPLALALDDRGPQLSDSSRSNLIHIMKRTGEWPAEPGGFMYMDDIVMLHTHASTQIDALSHVAYDGLLYNGVPASSVTDAGAASLGVETLGGGIVGRGVLLDLARHLGVDMLEASHVITSSQIEDCLDAQGVALTAGDSLLIRTGWIRHFVNHDDREAYMSTEPGIGIEAAVWLKDRDVAFVASDNWAIEVVPSVSPGETMPVHCLLVRDAGMPLGEMFNLEELAIACAGRQNWEFLFACSVLPITGGVGAPVAPLAIL